MASAQVDFADTVETMPPVERMSLLQCAEALRQGELLEIWLREVRSHLRDELISGKDAPGWMLVPKRAARRWISEDALLGWANLNGMDDAKLFNSPVLKTPAQLEKRLGKGNLPDDLIEAVSAGWNLVPA